MGALGALSFLAPVAESLGGTMELAQAGAQRQTSNQAFGKLLEAGGPDLEPFRQAYKAGMSPADVSAAMTGPVGEDIRQQYTGHRMGEIMQGPDFTKNLITAAQEGLIPWGQVLGFMKQPAKAPAVMPEDLKANAKQFLASNPDIDQDERSYIQGAIDTDNYGALKSINDKVIPPYFGSTKYSTRGWTMTGTDKDGVPFTTRYEQRLRGGTARVTSVYGDGTPVPQDKLQGSKTTGSFPDYGGGAGDYSTAAPAATPAFSSSAVGEPVAGAPSGAPPPSRIVSTGGGGIPAAPSGAPAAPAARTSPLTFGHLGATEVKTAANINSLFPQLESLQRNMAALGPDKWDRTVASRVFSKYVAQKLDVLPGTDAKVGEQAAKNFIANDKDMQKLNIDDPDMAHVMAQLITVDAMASVSLLASAGSRASNLLDKFSGHIVDPNGNWGSNMTQIQTLNATDGPYRSWLHAMRVNPSTPDPPEYKVTPSSSAAGGAPGAPGPAPVLPKSAGTTGPGVWDPRPTPNFPGGHFRYPTKSGDIWVPPR